MESGLLKVIHTKESLEFPTLVFDAPTPDGDVKTWWQIEVTPVIMDDGGVAMLLCNVNNVTEQELARQFAEDAKERELMLNRELTNVNEKLLKTVGDLRRSEEKLFSLNTDLELRIELRTSELTESEKRFRSILDSLPQIAWTSKPDGEVDFYNQKWYDYTGLTFEQSNEQGWREVIHPDDMQRSINILGEILASGAAGEVEIREKGKDGIYRWHLVRVNPLKNQAGKIVHLIGIATDIDDIKQIQHQKDDFISIASHELKTPITSLNAVLQLLERMKNNPSSEMLPKLISQGRRSMQKITTLVDDLLNLGRLDKGKLPINKTFFILSELVNACCNPVSLAGKHRIRILGDKQLRIFADEHRVDQVMVNLINNAVKYAPDSEEIVITIEKDGQFAKVSVADTGPGIAADKMAHLFDRYYRIEQSGYQASGLGLGLYISSEIIKRHGGEMGVNSQMGNGSTFWFTLPINA